MISIGFLLSLTTLSAAWLACAGVLSRVHGRAGQNSWVILAMAACLAPVLLGLTAMALRLAGAGPTGSVILAPLLFMAVCIAMRPPAPPISALRWTPAVAAVASLCLLASVSPLMMPLIENDALEYAAAAAILNRVNDISHFPMLASDPVTGLYAPAMHPPTFIATLAWMHSAGPEAGFAGQRLVAAWSLAGLLALVAALGARAGVGLWATILMLTTPFVIGTALALGVDLFRMAAFAAALAAVIIAIDRPDMRRIAAAGAVAGLAMWTHSLGVIAPAMGCLAFAALLPPEKRLRAVTHHAVVALLVGGAWYGRNLWLSGAVISDNWSVAEAPALRYAADMAARRGLDGVAALVVNGLLRPWTEPALYGATFWVMGLGLGRMAGPHAARTVHWVSAIAIAGYAALALGLMGVGSDLAVKNPRYWLTLAPCAALLGALGLGWLEKSHLENNPMARWGLIAIVLSTLTWSAGQTALRTVGLASPVLALSGHEEGFLDMPRVTGGPLIRTLASERDGRVLAFRSPDVVTLARRPVLDHADPALLNSHGADAAAAFAAVKARDVRWALVPDYTPVTLGFSALGDVLADPAFAEPVATHRNARLYRLRETAATTSCVPVPLEDPETLHVDRGPADLLATLTGAPQLRALGRGTQTRAAGNSMVWSASRSGTLTIPLRTPLRGRYVVSALVAGSGVIAVDAISDGARPSAIRLIDRLIDTPSRPMRAQWVATASSPLTSIRISPLAPGQGRADLRAMTVCAVTAH